MLDRREAFPVVHELGRFPLSKTSVPPAWVLDDAGVGFGQVTEQSPVFNIFAIYRLPMQFGAYVSSRVWKPAVAVVGNQGALTSPLLSSSICTKSFS